MMMMGEHTQSGFNGTSSHCRLAARLYQGHLAIQVINAIKNWQAGMRSWHL